MSRRSEAEVERAIHEAESLADELESLGSAAGKDAPLFARALRNMARTLRLAVVAQAGEDVLTRVHLRLETTMRRAHAQLVEINVPPPSQRQTLPPPPGLTPREVWDAGAALADDQDRKETRRPPPPATSEIRAKAVTVSMPQSKKKHG